MMAVSTSRKNLCVFSISESPSNYYSRGYENILFLLFLSPLFHHVIRYGVWVCFPVHQKKELGRIGQSAQLIGNRARLCLDKGVVVAGLVKGAFLYGGCRSVGITVVDCV